MKPKSTAKRSSRRHIACSSCGGSGREVLPDLDGITMSQLARSAGRSRSLVSRMLSDNVADGQKRLNPTLETMIVICKAVEAETGTPLGLGALARAIRS
jgi:transcriptional regulator with XRE-family HTH domain